jgi:hypothetical protein
VTTKKRTSVVLPKSEVCNTRVSNNFNNLIFVCVFAVVISMASMLYILKGEADEYRNRSNQLERELSSSKSLSESYKQLYDECVGPHALIRR